MSHKSSTLEAQARVAMHPPASLTTTGALGVLRLTWARWKQIAHAVGVVQTRILMVLFFFVAVFPLGLIMKRSADPLHLKEPADGNWTPHRHENPSLDTARRQF